MQTKHHVLAQAPAVSYANLRGKCQMGARGSYRNHHRILLCQLHKKMFLKESSGSQFSSVQSLSRVWLFATPWIAALQASLSITNSQSLPKLMSIESVMPSSHFILCRPLLLLPPSLPASESFPMSQLFAWGSQSIELQLWHQSFQWTPRTDIFQNGMVGSPCSPRDSQESSPTTGFKSINS